VVSLARDVLKRLPGDLERTAILVFGNVEAALLASSELQNQVVALDDPPEEALAGPIMLIGPSVSQVGSTLSSHRQDFHWAHVDRHCVVSWWGHCVVFWTRAVTIAFTLLQGPVEVAVMQSMKVFGALQLPYLACGPMLGCTVMPDEECQLLKSLLTLQWV
jgi:hypothetical protein